MIDSNHRVNFKLTGYIQVNEELRLRLNEFDEKYSSKEQEVSQFQRANLDLKSQLELMNLKFQQFNNNDTADKRVEHYLSEIDHQNLNELKVYYKNIKKLFFISNF